MRGREAIDLLEAGSTGHAGGVATIHAKTPVGAHYRFEQLCMRTIAYVPCELIAETVDVIALVRPAPRSLMDTRPNRPGVVQSADVFGRRAARR